MDSSTERIGLLDQRLLSQLAELQGMIGDSAQPWASVSPLFTNLAATWTSLQVGELKSWKIKKRFYLTQLENELYYALYIVHNDLVNRGLQYSQCSSQFSEFQDISRSLTFPILKLGKILRLPLHP